MNDLNTTTYSQSHILIEIERIVQLIESKPMMLNAELTNEDHPFYQSVINALPRLLTAYSPFHKYSVHIEVFWEACCAVGIITKLGFVLVMYPTIEQVMALMSCIAEGVKQPPYKRFKNDRRYQAATKKSHLSQYSESLHARYGRLLVVRVDFYYRMECQYRVTIDDVYGHLAMMTHAKYVNQTFENMVGSAWCIEQGETRGYHIHAVFYYLGAKHQNDWFKAQRIGELWQSITAGLGTYHSCNTAEEKDKYEDLGKLGVGMIHRSDAQACQNAIDAVGYLASLKKNDQHLRMKPKGRRAFATSN